MPRLGLQGHLEHVEAAARSKAPIRMISGTTFLPGPCLNGLARTREIPKAATNRMDAVTDRPVRSDSAGCGRSVREWALRQAGAAGPCGRTRHWGCPALGPLTAHYGYSAAKGASWTYISPG